jgi:hypothetical protein
MKLRQTDRWLSTKETIGNYTIYRFQNYTLAIEHIIGLELDSNKILKPIVINIKARVISSV